jgi:hypothetical protein
VRQLVVGLGFQTNSIAWPPCSDSRVNGSSGRQIRVIDLQGELIRELTLDPSRCHQPLGSR